MGHYPAGQRHFDEFRKFRQCDAVTRQHFTLGFDLQLRALYLLLDIQVGDAFHPGNGSFDPVAEREEFIQVGAEKFDRNIGLCTREHCVDTVRNRLSQFDIYAVQDAQFSAHVGRKFVF